MSIRTEDSTMNTSKNVIVEVPLNIRPLWKDYDNMPRTTFGSFISSWRFALSTVWRLFTLYFIQTVNLKNFSSEKWRNWTNIYRKAISVTFLLYADPYTKGAIVFCVTLYLTIVYLTYRRDNSWKYGGYLLLSFWQLQFDEYFQNWKYENFSKTKVLLLGKLNKSQCYEIPLFFCWSIKVGVRVLPSKVHKLHNSLLNMQV